MYILQVQNLRDSEVQWLAKDTHHITDTVGNERETL